ncbi:MAG: cytochrome c oxidase subunit II [Pirellulaceae bacterium]|nr:cytochrome c oxidase subunit II [Pirellulaceae bacterium]
MNLNLLPTLFAEHQGSFWFAPAGSTFAEETDWLFMVLLYISGFFFVLVVGAMVWFAIKFRRRAGYQGDSTALHNNALEIFWTIVPTIIVCWIFYRGVQGYMDMTNPPPETVDINVTASKWNWSFTYPNGAESNELHLPVDKSIRLRMRSNDVLHCFYVPAFRTKQDVVPGRLNVLWFHTILEGKFKLFCAEYCGDNHSEMLADVQVHSQEDYEKKLAELNKHPEAPVAHGEWLYERRGCKGCHSLEPGKVVIGPSFAGSWNKQFNNIDGQSVTFDEQYFIESVESPQAKMKPEFAKASQMPSYKGRLKPKEIDALIAMIRALEDGQITDEERNALPPPEEVPQDGAAQATATK